MNKTMLVHSFNGQDDLGDVKSRDRNGEDLVLDEHSHKISSWQELHQHVKFDVILECRVQLDDPWTVRLRQNITLCAYMRKLVFLEHLGLVQ